MLHRLLLKEGNFPAFGVERKVDHHGAFFLTRAGLKQLSRVSYRDTMARGRPPLSSPVAIRPPQPGALPASLGSIQVLVACSPTGIFSSIYMSCYDILWNCRDTIYFVPPEGAARFDRL
jgi:hypothetical protein